MQRFLISVVLLVYLFIIISGCATNPVTGSQDLVFMSEQQEIAMGRKTHQMVLEEYGVYDDPELQVYVQQIGQRLAAKSHRPNLFYRFTVLDSKDVNAFALPGGYIYITRGLMAYLNSESELAAVLGHEIGHVTARHSVRQYSATQLANIGATLGAVFIPGMNNAASNQLVNVFGAALLRGYGREHELEADRLGAEYLALNGYEPNAMLEVIGVLKDQETFAKQIAEEQGKEVQNYHGLFSTHPDNDKRLQEVVAHAYSLKDSGKSYIGQESFLQQMDGVVFGDSPEEGITRGNHFYHNAMNFSLSFPNNWHLVNRPDQLVITAPAGEAVIYVTVEDLNKRISPREFMIQRLGLNDLANESNFKIHGHSAHTGTSMVKTSQGQRIARCIVIFHGLRAFILLGITKNSKDINRFDKDFLATAKTFHTLTETERAFAEPLKLKVISTGNKTVAELASTSPIEKYAQEYIRLLNDLYPAGEPKQGQLLKIIQGAMPADN